MGNRLWKAYLGVAALLVAAYQVLPSLPWWTALWQTGIGYLAVTAVVVGTRSKERSSRRPWWFFAAGLLGNVSGILVITVLNQAGIDSSPNLSDPLFLLLYPGCAIGLALLIKRREKRRNWAALVDATTFATGIGLLAWVYVIKPAALYSSDDILNRVTLIAYPLGDLLLLAMLVRLVRSGGSRGPSFWLVTASGFAFFLGDTTWVVLNNLGVDITGMQVPNRLIDSVFLVAFQLFGLAALHPSSRLLDQPAARPAPRLSTATLSALTAASLMAPALLAAELVRGDVDDGWSIVAGCTVLFVLVVVRMAQLNRQMERHAERVRQLSREDELTGLPNRRAWNEELPRALGHARGAGQPLAVAMIDLDHFKRFNDAHGHIAGDELLSTAAAAWRAELRSGDVLARYGGEEFIVLLPGLTSAEAEEVLTRLLAATPLGQTFSCGVACWDGIETADDLVCRADATLYEAKSAGRNHVRCALQPV